MGTKQPSWFVWLTPILATMAITGLLLVSGRVGDVVFMPGGGTSIFEGWLLINNPQVSREVILAVLEVLAAVFAISITVVAIIVQLSATRYTSRVVDLFLADPFNVFIFFAYLVPMVYGFWVSNTLSSGGYSTISVSLFMVMATLSIVMVLPYFKYVFHFLQPRHIINRIEGSIEKSLREISPGNGELERRRNEVSNSIRQLSDIALCSIAQSDIVLALQCMQSLQQAAVYYLRHKPSLPDAWFEIGRGHIVGLSEDLWRETVEKRTWFELEIFKQFEIAFTTSLRKVRDINSYIARAGREIAEDAAARGEEETLELFIKGMNTFVMYALSERDTRTVVNVFYQYRLLGEAVLHRPEVVGRIAGHMRYYGQNSLRRRIFFIAEVIAYDLRMLIEKAYPVSEATGDALLEVMLNLDAGEEFTGEARFQKGLRKSQALLASHFVHGGRLDLAGRVHEAMRVDSKDDLAAIRKELLNAGSEEFWEIEDRGVSFYYVNREQQESLDSFFSWLLEEKPLPQESRTA